MSRIITTDPTILITDRLILRSWTNEEAAAVQRVQRRTDWADDFPAPGDKVISALFAAHPAWLGTYGHRLIIEQATGLVVGGIGLFWPPNDGQLEIGYGVVESRSGRGYATEAARCLTEFALAAPEVHTIFANVEVANPGSARVLAKAGFSLAGQHRGSGGEYLACYRLVAGRR